MVGLVIVDKDLTVFDVNKRMFECFHMYPREVAGASFGSVFWCGRKAPGSMGCRECKAAEKCSILKTARNILLDNLPCVYAVTRYPWHSKNQRGVKWFQIGGAKVTSMNKPYAVLSFVDITMQKRQEELLRRKLHLDQAYRFMNKQSLLPGLKSW